MILLDLIAFFRQGGTFEEFCKTQALNEKSEVIEIYAQEPACLEAHLGFFTIEETEGRVEFQAEGIRYHNLFDFFYFLDVLEDNKGSEGLTNSDLAQKLFTYAMKDS